MHYDAFTLSAHTPRRRLVGCLLDHPGAGLALTDRIVARCDVGNAPSSALARALGFRWVGEVGDTYPNGTPRLLLEFEMTREGFRGRRAAGLLRRARRAGLVTV